jgi:hypothetical protein
LGRFRRSAINLPFTMPMLPASAFRGNWAILLNCLLGIMAANIAGTVNLCGLSAGKAAPVQNGE